MYQSYCATRLVLPLGAPVGGQVRKSSPWVTWWARPQHVQNVQNEQSAAWPQPVLLTPRAYSRGHHFPRVYLSGLVLAFSYLTPLELFRSSRGVRVSTHTCPCGPMEVRLPASQRFWLCSLTIVEWSVLRDSMSLLQDPGDIAEESVENVRTRGWSEGLWMWSSRQDTAVKLRNS